MEDALVLGAAAALIGFLYSRKKQGQLGLASFTRFLGYACALFFGFSLVQDLAMHFGYADPNPAVRYLVWVGFIAGAVSGTAGWTVAAHRRRGP